MATEINFSAVHQSAQARPTVDRYGNPTATIRAAYTIGGYIAYNQLQISLEAAHELRDTLNEVIAYHATNEG
ncbi:hypothetical protein [Streptomyces sp. URMC 125]|uniref:hypothetical protein n=1 Tax=Streptomyces sp. URMC 125 TaxID=3423419 RepID=UPI003F1BB726